MLASFYKSLSCEAARRIIDAVKPQQVIVRINQKGAHQAWTRGFLIDANGKELAVKPFNHKQVEYMSPDTVRISTGHNSPETLEKIRVVIDAMNDANAIEHEATVPLPDLPEEVVTTSPLLPPTTFVPLSAPQTPVDLTDKLRQYELLRSEISERVRTEGVQRLHKLERDLDEARDLVKSIEDEIAEFRTQLHDWLPNAPKAKANKPKKLRVPANLQSHKQPLIKFFASHHNNWAYGKQLAALLNLDVKRTTRALHALVHEGFLQKQGVTSSTQYRLPSSSYISVALKD